ncbi:MAG TPA: YraN family protein [Bacteroidia bacterium]|nr:YraN family protein [Bacteroidia bacterium]HRD37381.1 YraN family protein [Bacteroidia bacterium]
MKPKAKNTGNWGEEQAIAYLRSKGYAILATQWRYKKYEVDIIAKFNNRIVFVEVKTRSSEQFGEPETFVSLQKQRFIVAAANQYMLEHDIEEEAQFDIVAILTENGKFTLNHLPDAFYPIVK